jgi:hypothetical protein
MPVHDGSRSDQDERLPPPGPERSQRNTEQLAHGSQSTARLLRVQSQHLATESQVLEDEVLPGTENAYQPAEEKSERYDHGKNMARILAENPNPAFRQVIHSAGVRRFGEAQVPCLPANGSLRVQSCQPLATGLRGFWKSSVLLLFPITS